MHNQRNANRLLSGILICSVIALSGCGLRLKMPDELSKPLATVNAAVEQASGIQPTVTATQVTGKEPTSVARTPRPVLAVGETTNASTSRADALPTAVPAGDRTQLDGEEKVLVNLYQRVNPAVVYIANEVGGRPVSSGSGFVIDKRGYIVTNNHVVAGAEQLDVTFSDGTVVPADLVGRDPYADLAVIKVDYPADKLVVVELGDSSIVQTGQKVIAIGNPYGLKGTMTSGIVSAVGRNLPERGETDTSANAGFFSNPDVIQTDAAINPGNSGGPLFDSRGRVIGVNTAIRTDNTGAGGASNSGIGFAVPVNTVKRVSQQLIADGKVSYPYLGIQMQPINNAVATQYKLSVQRGVLVSSVVRNGPGDRAGLRGSQVSRDGKSISVLGDVITAMDGRAVKDSDELISLLSATHKPDDTVTLSVLRDGAQVEVKVKLGERPR